MFQGQESEYQSSGLRRGNALSFLEPVLNDPDDVVVHVHNFHIFPEIIKRKDDERKSISTSSECFFDILDF